MKKKILFVCIAYCLGICAATWTESLLAEWIFVFSGMLAGFALVRKCARRFFVVLLSCMFLLGFVQTEHKTNTTAFIPKPLNGLIVSVCGSVRETKVYDTYTTYILKPQTVYIRLKDGGEQHFKVRGKISVSVEECDAVRKVYDYGECIEARGKLEFFEAAKSYAEFDYGMWQKAAGIYAGIFTKETSVTSFGKVDANPVLLAANRIRSYISETICQEISGDAGALLNGILIGERGAFSPAFEQALQTAGLSHICSVSGMHVGILYSLLMWIFVNLRLRRRIYYPLCALALHFFAFIAGGGAAIIRAVLMFDLCMLAYWTRGDEDRPFTCLCVGFLMLLVQPLYLLNTGFLLSFASVFGILFLGRRTEAFLSAYIQNRMLRSMIAISLCAQLFNLPILAGSFHVVSVYALLYNVLLTWLVAPVMILAVAFLIISLFWSGGAQALGFVLEVILQGMRVVILTVNFLPFHVVSVSGGVLFSALYYSVLAWIYTAWKKKEVWMRWCKGVVCFCMVVFTVVHCTAGYTAKVHFLDVGEGDCALVQLPFDINILIDAGGSVFGSQNTDGNKVVSYLRSVGVSKLDCAIVSHYDTDHAQGMVAVCEALKVRQLILPYRESGFSATYKTLLEEVASKRKIKVRYTKGGEEFSLPGGLHAEVLSPDAEMLKYCNQENDLSLVMRLSYGKFRMLFTGDAQALAENRLLAAKKDLQADLLKVAHHGASTSSTDYFIDAVSPRLAVISSGDYAVNGHPALRTLVTLGCVGAVVERTAVMGDLVFEITKAGAWRMR